MNNIDNQAYTVVDEIMYWVNLIITPMVMVLLMIFGILALVPASPFTVKNNELGFALLGLFVVISLGYSLARVGQVVGTTVRRGAEQVRHHVNRGAEYVSNNVEEYRNNGTVGNGAIDVHDTVRQVRHNVGNSDTINRNTPQSGTSFQRSQNVV